jgi:hypothetical protein
MNRKILVGLVLMSMLALLVPMAIAKTPIVEQVTGGGWILYGCAGESKKTFGFNVAELEDFSLKGKLQYVDHGTKMNVHGYEILGLIITGDTAEFWGNCRVNGKDGYIFFVSVVDADEPGKHDYFYIAVNISGGYSAGAELGFPDEAGGGGNIQIHRPPL